MIRKAADDDCQEHQPKPDVVEHWLDIKKAAPTARAK
jgi:hypothetical protein